MTWIKSATLLAAVMACAAPALAAEVDPMASFYGNRLRMEIASGDWRGVRVYSPDHTYRDTFEADGQPGSATGHWNLEGDKVCVQADEPGAKRFCNLGPGHKLGDRWTDVDPYTGNPLQFTLEPSPGS